MDKKYNHINIVGKISTFMMGVVIVLELFDSIPVGIGTFLFLLFLCLSSACLIINHFQLTKSIKELDKAIRNIK
jgi:uncharacterized membrane protein